MNKRKRRKSSKFILKNKKQIYFDISDGFYKWCEIIDKIYGKINIKIRE